MLDRDSKKRIRELAKELRNTYEQKHDDLKWYNETRKKHEILISKLLSSQNIRRLNRSDFRRLVEELWAFGMWSNKIYAADKIINDNGMKKIRVSLNNLLYGSESLERRFDSFNIKCLSTASVTEIMSIVNPNEYALWNNKSRKVLTELGVDRIHPRAFKHTKMSGSDYAKCNEIMKEIVDLLGKEGYKNMDLLDLGIFIWIVFERTKKKTKKKPKPPRGAKPVPKPSPPTPNITHWDAIGRITEIGNALGFDTYVADPAKKYMKKPLRDIATIKDIPEQYENIHGIEKVDVIWFRSEPPIYMFEVEDKGTMRDALLRLFQARVVDSRFLVVCPTENQSKFEKWVTTAPFKEYRQRYQFRSFDELISMYDAVMNYAREKKRFL